jgi:hypothetical protein
VWPGVGAGEQATVWAIDAPLQRALSGYWQAVNASTGQLFNLTKAV